MNYPFLRKRDRGTCEGLLEIVFSENQGYEEAQDFAAGVIATQGMTLLRKLDGPDAWLWDVRIEIANFVFGYDDFPCETTLFAADQQSERTLGRLFAKIVGSRKSNND